MGLNIFAQTTAQEIPLTHFKPPNDAADLFHWRGHWSLVRWMEILFRLRGFPKDNFICATFRLDSADLDALEKAIEDGEIKKAYPRHITVHDTSESSDDALFIAGAREAIASGRRVFCFCSW